VTGEIFPELCHHVQTELIEPGVSDRDFLLGPGFDEIGSPVHRCRYLLAVRSSTLINEGLFQFLPLFPDYKESFAFILRGKSWFLQNHVVGRDRLGICDDPLVCKIIDQPACTTAIHAIICCSIAQSFITCDKNGFFRLGKDQNRNVVK